MTLPQKQKYLIAVEGYPTADPGVAVTGDVLDHTRWVLTHVKTGRRLGVPVSFDLPETALECVERAYGEVCVPWHFFEDHGQISNVPGPKSEHAKLERRWRALIHKIAEEKEEGL